MGVAVAPKGVNAPIPDLGIDARALKKATRKLGGVFYKRVVAMVYNEMQVSAIKTLEAAKSQGSKYFDNTTVDTIGPKMPGTYQTGLMVNGLFHWPRPVVNPKGGIVMGFGWTRRYGRVLEFGPSITEWMIYPKWKKALRFMSGNFMGPTRSGIAGSKIQFVGKRKDGKGEHVRHKWSTKQLRPHLVPSVKAQIPKLEKRIARGIEREFMRTKLNG